MIFNELTAAPVAMAHTPADTPHFYPAKNALSDRNPPHIRRKVWATDGCAVILGSSPCRYVVSQCDRQTVGFVGQSAEAPIAGHFNESTTSQPMGGHLEGQVVTGELIKLPADQLLNKFGSGNHKPGSGSAAALIGLLACKLLQTVVSLTNGRDQYQGVVPQLTLANQDILNGIEPKLVSALQSDSEQFERVIQARRLRDAEEDRNKRRALSERALEELRKATDIPIEIAEVCLTLAEKALIVFDLGFKAARGDSGVALSSALAAASGSLSIVYLNLSRFKGSDWAVKTRKRADVQSAKLSSLQMELATRIDQLREAVVHRESLA